MDVINSYLVVRHFFNSTVLLIVVAEVSRVEKVVLDRVLVTSQTFYMVRSDKPRHVVFRWHRSLNGFKVVIRRQVKRV